MRVFKSPEEIELMQHAADIAAEAHVEAMKAVRPGMKEYEVEALIEQIFRRHGAAGPSYTSIVGAGANATVLHYISNNGELRDGELLLIDRRGVQRLRLRHHPNVSHQWALHESPARDL